MSNRSAISRFFNPSDTNWMISRSRGVKRGRCRLVAHWRSVGDADSSRKVSPSATRRNASNNTGSGDVFFTNPLAPARNARTSSDSGTSRVQSTHTVDALTNPISDKKFSVDRPPDE